MQATLKPINLGLRFLLELAMLAAFAFWGFHTGAQPLAKILLGVGVPLLVAVIWGALLAPRSSRRLQDPAYSILVYFLFGLAALGLVIAGQVVLAVILAVVFVANDVMLR